MATLKKKPAKRGATKPTAKNEAKLTTSKTKRSQVKAPTFNLQKLYTTKAITAIWLLAFGVLVFGGAFWFIKVYKSPERVFWGMIGNSLSTSGYTRQIVQGTEESGKSDEISKVTFGPNPGVAISKEITQVRQEGKTTVKVQGVGTPEEDFQHYSEVSRPAFQGKTFDYSKLYNLWVHSNASQGKKATQQAQLFSQTLLNTFMFGNLPAEKRIEIVQFLRANNVYSFDSKKVNKVSGKNREVYAYDVKIKTRNLALALQKYGKLAGIKAADSVNPDSYSPEQEFNVRINIDVLSRRLVSVDYTGTGVVEKYFAYGVNAKTLPPANFVDVKTYSGVINNIEN